jgi:hypothetical protein
MAPGQALRRTLAIPLTAVVAAGVLVACSSPPPPKPRLVVDSTVNQAPAKAIDVDGPPPAALRANWRIDIRGVTRLAGDVGFELLAGQVVLMTEQGITAYDGRTGSERWHYREPGRSMIGYAATQGQGGAAPFLVGFTEQRKSARRAIGIDAATGKVLWNAPRTWQPVINPKNRKAVAGAGVIMGVDQSPEGPVMLGIDAQNGQVRWTQRRLEYCDPDSLQGIANTDGSIFVLPEGCFTEVSEVHGFDPATGSVRWRRRPPPDFTDAIIRGGVTLLNSQSIRASGASMLLSSSGKRMRAIKPPVCSYGIGCHFVAARGRLFLADAKGTGRPKMLVVDPKRGKAKTVTFPNGSADDNVVLSGTGGKLYGLRKRLAAKLLPAELDIFDPKTLGLRRVAMPFAFHEAGIGEYHGVGRVEAADGLLYILGDRGGKLRLTAYAPSGVRGPAELGGTQVKDWPDACKLFRGIGKQLRPGNVEQLGLGRVRLARWGCTFSWKSRLKTGALVIGWVAPDDKQAVEMLAVDPAQAHLLSDVADQAYTFTNSDQGGPDLVMRLGRHIIASYGIREQEQDLAVLARTWVKNLRELPSPS